MSAAVMAQLAAEPAGSAAAVFEQAPAAPAQSDVEPPAAEVEPPPSLDAEKLVVYRVALELSLIHISEPTRPY